MWFCFSEIYNEEIRDLLATEKGLKYDIKKLNAKSNDIYVTNLKIEDVTNGSENIKVLLKRAQKNRAVAATNCNERSSRSHSVFMLKIIGNNSVTSESCTGMYQFYCNSCIFISKTRLENLLQSQKEVKKWLDRQIIYLH